jgi:LmbE family N-acetylglucosaminyl deacetylase
MTQLRVLATYGHPDDEGQVTGTLRAFLQAGAEVTLVCATRGEGGVTDLADLATPETLGYVRELELRAAMAQIGLFDVRFLDYRDSGMEGTPENEDPRCLHQQPADVVVGEYVRLMRERRPHVVFTWAPDGGYGHPDHVAVHRHAVAAFDASADPEAYPDAGEPWQPHELYWGARTMKRMANMWFELEKRGLLPEPMNDERRVRFEKALAEPDPVASIIHDVREHAPYKRAAAGMHRTQFGENSLFARIPEEFRADFYGEERFFRARPEWDGGEAEQDIARLLTLSD